MNIVTNNVAVRPLLQTMLHYEHCYNIKSVRVLSIMLNIVNEFGSVRCAALCMLHVLTATLALLAVACKAVPYSGQWCPIVVPYGLQLFAAQRQRQGGNLLTEK